MHVQCPRKTTSSGAGCDRKQSHCGGPHTMAVVTRRARAPLGNAETPRILTAQAYAIASVLVSVRDARRRPHHQGLTTPWNVSQRPSRFGLTSRPLLAHRTPTGCAPVTGVPSPWGAHAHGVDEDADHPHGVNVARCGHRPPMVTVCTTTRPGGSARLRPLDRAVNPRSVSLGGEAQSPRSTQCRFSTYST